MWICFVRPTVSFARDQALLVIDMQDRFLSASTHQPKIHNARLLNTLISQNIELIRLARTLEIPIFLVEYAEGGRTDSRIQNELEGYPHLHEILKTTDGIFDERNEGLPSTFKSLRELGTKELIMVGINGDYCVAESIFGALANRFRVTTYSRGIASLVRPAMVSPFFYPKIKHANFRELHDLSDFQKSVQCRAAFAP